MSSRADGSGGHRDAGVPVIFWGPQRGEAGEISRLVPFHETETSPAPRISQPRGQASGGRLKRDYFTDG